jgi:hypothetical protein
VKISTLCVLAGLAAVTSAVAAQESALIRKELKEGAVDTYKVEIAYKQKIISEQMGEQDFNVVGTLLYATKIGKFNAEKKQSDLEVTLSKVQLALTGMAMVLQGQVEKLPKEIKLQGKVDDRNQVKELKADATMASSAALLSLLGGAWTQFAVLPEQAVKPGDAWDFAVPKLPAYGNKEFKLQAKLVGEKVIGTAPVWIITLDGVLPMDMDLSALGSETGGQSMKLVGPLDFHMEAAVEKANGRLLEMKSTGKGKQNLELPDSGMSVEVNGEATTKMTWVLPAAAKITN